MSLFVPGYHAMRNRWNFANQYWANVTVNDIAHGRNRNARETRKHAGTEGGKQRSDTHVRLRTMAFNESSRGKMRGWRGYRRTAAAWISDHAKCQIGAPVTCAGRGGRNDMTLPRFYIISTENWREIWWIHTVQTLHRNRLYANVGCAESDSRKGADAD